MDFSLALAAWGTPDFASRVMQTLEEKRNDFPFDDFCTEGGWGDDKWHDFVIHSFTEARGSIVVKGSVDFRECVATGCRDITFKEDRKASFVLTIGKETGDYKLEPEPDGVFGYGEYY